MPQLLRSDSIRLLEASRHSLELALASLAFRLGDADRVPETVNAPHVGLIGVAAELGMSACIVQVEGESGLRATDTRYKTGRQILGDFRQMVRNGVPASAFLVAGVPAPGEHRQALIAATDGFSTLMAARASGLHGGHGVCRDVCLEVASGVSSFLRLLAASSKIRPYLLRIPEPPSARVSRHVLVEDLARRAQDGTGGQAAVLATYLLLPEVPEAPPEWLDAFERLTVTPSRTDIDLLLRHLEQAVPVGLRRATGDGQAVPVVVARGTAGAIPVDPHRLRACLRELIDQWHAAAAVAAGRIADGQLAIPDRGIVVDVFLANCEARLELDEASRSPHRIWPLIVAAVSGPGTPLPYWFLLRMTQDLGQLGALVAAALPLATPSAQVRLERVVAEIHQLRGGVPLPEGGPLSREIRSGRVESERRRGELAAKAIGERAPRNEEDLQCLREVSEGTRPVGDALNLILDGGMGFDESGRRYWGRLMAEASSQPDDVAGLVKILRDPVLAPAHTAVRKALRLIDQLRYGPQLAGQEAE
ncbi:hypothetical protein L6V77_25615 [Myxococcota bacterium]|nr:hypothetical protein [Myxococcota bacterium]